MAIKKTARTAPTPKAQAPAAESLAPAIPATPEPVAATAVRKQNGAMVGAIAYVFGLVIAFGAAVFFRNGIDWMTYAVLAVLGLIVGVINISDDEVLTFLVASVAFMLSANGIRIVLGEWLFIQTFMNGIIVFTASSAFIVSLKAIFKTAKSE